MIYGLLYYVYKKGIPSLQKRWNPFAVSIKVYFKTSLAASTINIKLVAPPPSTYSVCCQK